MYQINKIQNKITKLKEYTFSELKFKEREHLQEWLADNPESLGEELLIIQKEFDGFNDTKERLDLLALDKQGRLNKGIGSPCLAKSLPRRSDCSSERESVRKWLVALPKAVSPSSNQPRVS